MRLSRFYKNRPQLIVLFALTLAIVNELWTNVLFFCGVATSDPLALEEEAIVRSVYTDSALNRGDDTKKNISWITRTNESKSIIRLAAYDEVSLYHKDQSSTTTPLWDVYPSDKDVSIGRLSSNATSCFGGGIFGSVHCLPSFLILGFEKCGTTVLNIWLSYHPNLLTNWFEGRFFDSLPTPADVETEWRQYLRSLPRIPGGKGSVSKYWTFDKSPGYATNIQAAQAAARLIPNARLLFLTRNPTQRAYSFFLMLTNHYVRGQKVSYFAKSDVTGGVVYVRPPGKGGALVPDGVIGSKSKSNNNKTDIKWRYLSYPPDPSDFHNWVEHAIAKAKTNLRLDHQGRPNRILQGGIYAEYLKKWLTYFPMEQFIIVPTESFHKDTLNSMNQLQAMMRLPTFDYSSIAKKDEKSGRVDIPASLGTTLNSFINSYKPQKPMLDTTRYLLNEFYCESNRKLTQMLGGRALPGYSCGEEGV